MGEMVSYRSNGGTSEGYLAMPASGGGPAVVVIREWWGLVPHITSVVERFAEAGFVALAPDLYHGVHTAEPDEAGKLLMGLAMDQAARDIAGAAAHLAPRPEVTDKIGCVGFCAGGSLAMWSATLAFFNDDRPEAYHADAAKSAWARTLELLRTRLPA